MTMTREQAAMKASRARTEKAKVRRFRRYLDEMRADGLEVMVRGPDPDGRGLVVVPEYFASAEC